MNIKEKVDRFNQLQEKSDLKENEEQELNNLAEEFLEITKQVYNRSAVNYDNVDEMSDSDIANFDTLFQVAEEVLGKPIQDMSVLDCRYWTR